jgi:membrane protein YqaA with SNARE-associated domain
MGNNGGSSGSSGGSGSSADLRQLCRNVYDGWARFSSTRAGLLLMFTWAVAEATIWPLIPDFLLMPMVLTLAAANYRRFFLPLAACVTGAALGGIILYLLANSYPEAMLNFVGHLPLVSDRQVALAQSYLKDYGVAAYLYQPWSGAPFKVWGVVGASLRLDPVLVIPVFIVGRAFRMTILAILAALAGLFGGKFSGFLRDYSLFVAAIYVVLFLFGWWQISG